MNQKNLKERCKQYLTELGVPVTVFCRQHLGISTNAYYDWQRDDLVLSESTANRISGYLQKYGF